ncbi:MAG TPA: oxidoreductase [Methylocystis sp.]
MREAPILKKADSVPSLIRFLVIVGVLVALGYAGMFAVVSFVTPQPREMTQSISPARLNK